jgi:predicted Fe-Mo cluster-binding NifX family protein
MKIALPSRDGLIDGHFGHCEYFTIVTIEDGKISNEEKLNPPEGCGCKSNVVPTMAEMGVKLMLAGSMGQGAVNMLNSHGIEVFRGLTGTPKDAVNSWLMGQLKDSGENCSDHEGCH